MPAKLQSVHAGSGSSSLAELNHFLAGLAAAKRVEWALAELPGEHVLTSSFGVQAAVSLHLITRVQPDIPIILADTGYLFPETYRFIDLLTGRLKLNLHVCRAEPSPAWQEARHGKRWEQGATSLEAYNEDNKVAPVRRALETLRVGTWFAGLRRSQSSSRARIPYIERHGKRWKVHPIADWTDRDVHQYLSRHGLPYHPLREEGYVSIGDIHSTLPLHLVNDPDETRFVGVKRECGIHEIDLASL